MLESSQKYWEVDQNHPYFGIGKFDFTNVGRLFTTEGTTFQDISWPIACWMRDRKSPGNKAIYGEKFRPDNNYSNHVWTNGHNGNEWYWIFNAQMTITSPVSWWTAQVYHAHYTDVTGSQMTSVMWYNEGVSARGFANADGRNK